MLLFDPVTSLDYEDYEGCPIINSEKNPDLFVKWLNDFEKKSFYVAILGTDPRESERRLDINKEFRKPVHRFKRVFPAKRRNYMRHPRALTIGKK